MGQVRNTRQALDALAYYALKDVTQKQLAETPGKLPTDHVDRAFRYVVDSINQGEDFRAALNRHAVKFPK